MPLDPSEKSRLGNQNFAANSDNGTGFDKTVTVDRAKRRFAWIGFEDQIPNRRLSERRVAL